MKRASILVVDDEEKTRRILEVNLGHSYDIHLAENGAAAMDAFRQHHCDIILTDLRMPDMDGTMILREIRRGGHPTPVIVMTAYGTIESAVALMKEGAFDYIVKPVNLDQLDISLRRAEQHVKLLRENEQLRTQLRSLEGVTKIVTASPVMQELLKSVGQAAATQFTVLIEGETGTGKELIARAVHDLSPRASKPFVPVNCGAIPRELLESELFGSERGAFTGATTRRIGRFEQADGGSLFLDEIGELPLELQVKLLRSLEEQAIVRIGGSDHIKLDLRIIAATNRKLRAEVEAGRFRDDLFYRLNVVKLEIPPLRERPEDIPLLAQHFLLKHRQGVGKEVMGFEPAALTYLKSLSWPGNVRELENAVVRSMVSCRGEFVQVDDLPSDLHMPASGDARNIPSTYPEFLARKKALKDAYLEKLQKAFIIDGLRANHWNVSQTARALGMDRRKLQNMMKMLDLQQSKT
ncbi:MAG: sigma-54-dependent Fis family transcriptional regulator [Bacteroidetes bacterium]|nr:sigma-54-dependent Fis family transcriptional regulator [Bacteroidota bacterium]